MISDLKNFLNNDVTSSACNGEFRKNLFIYLFNKTSLINKKHLIAILDLHINCMLIVFYLNTTLFYLFINNIILFLFIIILFYFYLL